MHKPAHLIVLVTLTVAGVASASTADAASSLLSSSSSSLLSSSSSSKATAGGSGAPWQARSAYTAPVLPLRVLRAFQAPLTRYGPGHRGVDLVPGRDGRVRAAAAGVVTFAGPVAGRGVVVVLHSDGVRTEYEPLALSVHRGQTVTGATVLGTVAGHHLRCATCLHWGARRDAVYFDPMSLLRPLGPVRLVPWRGNG